MIKKMNKRIDPDRMDSAKKMHNKYLTELVFIVNKLLAQWHEGKELVHELRNPLTGIYGAAQVLLDEFEDGDEKKKLIEEMLVQLKRLDASITNFTHFLKSLEPGPSPVNLNELLAALCSEIGYHEKITIDTRLDAFHDYCSLDEILTRAAIYKLIQERVLINNINKIIVQTRDGEKTSEVLLSCFPASSGEKPHRFRDNTSEAPPAQSPFINAAMEILDRQGAKLTWNSDCPSAPGFRIAFPLAERNE